jgi:hypothetical protein
MDDRKPSGGLHVGCTSQSGDLRGLHHRREAAVSWPRVLSIRFKAEV